MITRFSRRPVAGATSLFLAIVVLAYSAVHFFRIGGVSPTTDEAGDLAVVSCFTKTFHLTGCNRDITQAPLPYYLHGYTSLLLQNVVGARVHLLISYVLGVLNLILLFVFTRVEFGRKTGFLTVILAATSIPLLASSRMVLTHSNILFCLLSSATLISFYYFTKRRSWFHGLMTTVFFSLSLSSNLLASSLLMFFAIYVALNPLVFRELIWKCLVLGLVALVGFFVVAPFYLHGDYLSRMAKGLFLWRPHFWYFNYFLLNQNVPPWWFSLLTFIVKVGPWWATIYFLFPCWAIWKSRCRPHRNSFLLALQASLLVFLLLTTSVYKIAAPHHQVHFYPFVYVTIAYTITRFWRFRAGSAFCTLVPACLTAIFALQFYDVVRFFPQYLFYGAQYGDRFVGEYYGPAVIQCQDSEAMKRKVRELAEQGESVLEMGLCPAPYSERHVFFDKRDARVFRYVAADYLMLNTLTPTRGALYRTYLRAHRCREYWWHKFPAGYTAYVIYQCGAS